MFPPTFIIVNKRFWYFLISFSIGHYGVIEPFPFFAVVGITWPSGKNIIFASLFALFTFSFMASNNEDKIPFLK